MNTLSAGEVKLYDLKEMYDNSVTETSSTSVIISETSGTSVIISVFSLVLALVIIKAKSRKIKR
ncbi:MAG: hypothetical protein ACFFBD_13230 [Candidatus Hodarchaeota archaeon]